MSLIEFRNIVKRFGRQLVLNGVDLNIDEGQMPHIVILGASGSGKSVLLKHMVGLLKPDSGEVWFDGQRIDNLPERQFSKLRIQFGFLFQMGALFDSMNVESNVGFPLVEHTNKTPAQIHEIVEQKLRHGRPARRRQNKMPGELSGGQPQAASRRLARKHDRGSSRA